MKPPQTGRMPDELLGLLRERMRARSYDAGATIHAPDRPSDRLFLIDEGLVRFTMLDSEGAERELFTLGSNEIFGEIGLLSGFDPPHHATATGPATIRSIDDAGLRGLMDEVPALRDWMLARLARRLLLAYHQLNQDRYGSPETRVLRYLRWLASNGFAETNDAGGLSLAITQQALADRVGLSRSTISETIEALRDSGRIKTGYGSITLPGEAENAKQSGS